MTASELVDITHLRFVAIVALDGQDIAVAQVVVHRDVGLRPLGRQRRMAVRNARIAACRAEIALHEAFAQYVVRVVAVDRAPEDRPVLLRPERNVVAQEDEVAELVEVEQYRVGIVARNRAALDDRRNRRHLGHVAGDHVPQQAIVEPARKFVGIEEISRADTPAEAMFSERMQPLGQRHPLCRQAVVVIDALQDVVAIAARRDLGQHAFEPLLQQAVRHGVPGKVPHEVEQLDGFVVENTVQSVVHSCVCCVEQR